VSSPLPPPFCARGIARCVLSARSLGKCIELTIYVCKAVKAFVARVRKREHQ
jgi:hypothetical protein